MPQYSPEEDIPNLAGKVILITGGTAGLGAQTLHSLAAHSPSHIFFTGRSTSRANELISTLKTKFAAVPVTFVEVDQASLASVQAGVQIILSQTDRLDILIANAGILGAPAGLTKNGYEVHFGVNYLSHALFVKLLLPTLLETTKKPGADVRVLMLSSVASSMHPLGGIIFPALKTPQSMLFMGLWQRYGQSKLANLLYAAELARQYPDSGILFVSVHPGVFNTGMVNSLGIMDKAVVWGGSFWGVKDEAKEGEGGWNMCWAATSKREDIENGAYYTPVGIKGSKVRQTHDTKLAGQLWEWTQKELEGWK